jgi:hypothetical protein
MPCLRSAAFAQSAGPVFAQPALSSPLRPCGPLSFVRGEETSPGPMPRSLFASVPRTPGYAV